MAPIPTDLRNYQFDCLVVIQVTFGRNGTATANVKRSSAFPELDEVGRLACAKMHFKTAMQDGVAVDDTQDFPFHFVNKPNIPSKPLPTQRTDDIDYWHAGVTRPTKFAMPRMPPIPTDLKEQGIDTTVSVRVSFKHSGQLHAIVKKSSGYPSLDEAFSSTCARIKFKPAMEDGKPVDDDQVFATHFTNKLPTRSQHR